jgi:hypothetical protein
MIAIIDLSVKHFDDLIALANILCALLCRALKTRGNTPKYGLNPKPLHLNTNNSFGICIDIVCIFANSFHDAHLTH